MKHKVVVIVCVLVAIALGFASAKAYDRYRSYRHSISIQANIARQKQSAAKAIKADAFQKGLTKLKTQCARDKATYTALPAAQQVRTTPPDCDANLVQ